MVTLTWYNWEKRQNLNIHCISMNSLLIHKDCEDINIHILVDWWQATSTFKFPCRSSRRRTCPLLPWLKRSVPARYSVLIVRETLKVFPPDRMLDGNITWPERYSTEKQVSQYVWICMFEYACRMNMYDARICIYAWIRMLYEYVGCMNIYVCMLTLICILYEYACCKHMHGRKEGIWICMMQRYLGT